MSCWLTFPMVAVLILWAANTIQAAGPTTAPTPDTVLKGLRPGHPRLILTDERLAELKKLAETDKTLQRYVADTLKRADGFLNQPPVEYKLIGPRLLNVSRANVARQYALALAWRWTGKDAYARKAVDNLLAAAEFKDWNPSHFLDTAEMSNAVGVGYDWLYAYMDAATREKVRSALIKLGMEPGLKCYRTKAWSVTNDFNWNQVCNGGLSVGALAITDSDPQYAREMLPKAVEFLPRALASYDPDGAWPEGPGYWGYATEYTAFGLSALQTALGTDFGLSKRQGLARAGSFPITLAGPTGLYVNFADVGENSRLRPLSSLFWLARLYNLPALSTAEHELLAKAQAGPMDVVWYVPPGNPVHPTDLDTLFRGPVELAVFRSAWNDPNALFVSLKAGFNQVNHGHLDLGAFELDALGQRFARDLGSDDYNLPGYWEARKGGQRWTYYRLNSQSHNVPLLDGKNQDELAKAKLVKFRPGGDAPMAIVDITSAYPQAKKVLRGVMMAGRRAVLVQDETELEGTHDMLWGMTTDAEITVAAEGPGAGRVATLRLNGKELRAIANQGIFTVESAEQQPPQKPNTGVRRLVVRLPKQSGRVTLTVYFTPATDPPTAMPGIPEQRPLDMW